ncbi:hypothetical protein F2P81_009530 [Scophthalmus maximus]|uniref:Uncharacterized protein n=1 Tax=Scophthalmus maximus TaxID=52904 RepID=A0A6A4SUZ0_SCOMX|nr:hypothetical protein F2P81_009530 [Scophthalmus maximus]
MQPASRWNILSRDNGDCRGFSITSKILYVAISIRVCGGELMEDSRVNDNLTLCDGLLFMWTLIHRDIKKTYLIIRNNTVYSFFSFRNNLYTSRVTVRYSVARFIFSTLQSSVNPS